MKSDPYEFDSQTKFKDTPRSRHGLPWEDWELNKLRSLYLQGDTLQCICDLMERPKEGVLPKLANLRLITKQRNGFFWIWKRKVLPDAWKVATQLTRKEEDSPTGQGRDTYPYQVAAIDCLDAGIFKGASWSVVTEPEPDLLGLELRAFTATTTGHDTSPQPSLQVMAKIKQELSATQTCGFSTHPPKEPIMKIETRTFINDQDASTMTDDQIFGEIRRAEKRIEEMKAIKTPTKKLAAAIEQLEDYASKLAAYVDGR